MAPEFHTGILNFILARRHEKGGYGAAPTLPPSVEDTYHALRILQGLSSCLADRIPSLLREPALLAYLKEAKREEGWTLRTLFHYLSACKIVAPEIKLHGLEDFVLRTMRRSQDLVGYYYCLRIWKEYFGHATDEDLRGIKRNLPNRWSNVEELDMLLYVTGSAFRRLHTGKKDLISWLQACQNPDGGFGFLPGTTSFIKNCHRSLRALSRLHAHPLQPAAAKEFILRCQTAGGGFARRNGAAPFLDATWHGVAALGFLAKMDARAENLPCEPGQDG